MIYIGIDLGLKGGIAGITSDGECYVKHMPTLADKEKEYDIKNISITLDEIIQLAPTGLRENTFAVIETATVSPKWKKSTIASMHRAQGIFEALLTMKSIPHQITPSRVWQKNVFKGMSPKQDTKTKSKLLCSRMYPDVECTKTERSKKEHDGMTDALCIATYAKRFNIRAGD